MNSYKQRDCTMLPGLNGWCARHDPKGGGSDSRPELQLQRMPAQDEPDGSDMTQGSGGAATRKDAARVAFEQRSLDTPGALHSLRAEEPVDR